MSTPSPEISASNYHSPLLGEKLTAGLGQERSEVNSSLEHVMVLKN